MANGLRRFVWAGPILAAAGALAAGAPPLAELPVADLQLVPAVEYEAASVFAAQGAAPLAIALRIVGAFEGSTQYIVQVNEGGEAPRASRVTVLRDGLLDDSVRGERWDIALERTTGDVWVIKEVKRAWRCWRGERQAQFGTALCP